MNPPVFSLSANGAAVLRESDGVMFEYPFTFENRRYWTDKASIDSATTKTTNGTYLRLQIENDKILKARAATLEKDKPKLAAAGTCVSELDLEEATPSPKGHVIAFGLHRYEVGQDAIDKRAMQLPDGRVVALYQAPSGRIIPAGVMLDGAPAGLAIDLDAPKTTALTLPGPEADELAPIDTAELTELFWTPEQIEKAKTKAPIVNLPICFTMLGHTDPKNLAAGMRLTKMTCTPLARVKVPADFGAKRDDDRPRFAYLVLVLAPGAIGADRDEKGFDIEPGTIAWLDEKHDLRGLARHLPRSDEKGRAVKACIMQIDAMGKVPFTLKTGPNAGTTGQTWRIEVRYLGNEWLPERLKLIERLCANLPPLPFLIEEIDAVAKDTEGDDFD